MGHITTHYGQSTTDNTVYRVTHNTEEYKNTLIVKFCDGDMRLCCKKLRPYLRDDSFLIEYCYGLADGPDNEVVVDCSDKSSKVFEPIYHYIIYGKGITMSDGYNVLPTLVKRDIEHFGLKIILREKSIFGFTVGNIRFGEYTKLYMEDDET